jgi:hypothetical protein
MEQNFLFFKITEFYFHFRLYSRKYICNVLDLVFAKKKLSYKDKVNLKLYMKYNLTRLNFIIF